MHPTAAIIHEPQEDIKALKYDQGCNKLSWSLMPFDAVEGMIRILEYGKRKYTVCGDCKARIYPNPRLNGGDSPRTDCPRCKSKNIVEGSHNWRKGFSWTRLIDSSYRHLKSFLEGNDRDEESGELHIHHLMCCVAFLAEHQTRHLGTDDRFKYNNEGVTI